MHSTDRSGPARLVGAAAIVVVAGLVAAWLAWPSGGGRGDGLVLATSSRLPHERLTDLVTFADVVAVVQVVDERRGRPEPPEAGGLTLRFVTVRLEQRLWTRPGSKEIPDEITFDTFGWGLREGKEVEARSADAPRLEVGHRYLLPLATFADGSVQAIANDATLAVVDGRIQVEPIDRREVATALGGTTPDEAAKVLGDVEPWPEAERFRDLDPDARFLAADEVRVGAAGPGG